MAALNLSVILSLVDRLSAPLRGARAHLTEWGSRLQAVGGQMAMMGAAGTAAMAKPVLAFAAAEEAATQLQVALMGAGGEVGPAFADINALALRLGNTLPGTTADFQQMMTMLVRQGMAADTILGGTGEAAARLGVMLKLPAAGAAEFAAKLQDATKTSAADMVNLADTIQRTFYLGVDPGNMLGAFSALAPAMATIRQEGLAGAQAMAPLVALLDQAGLAGGSAGNALRKVFQGGFDAKGVGKANDALREFGVSLNFLDQGGEFAGLDNLFAQLQKLQGLTTETRLGALKEIWGDDSETLQALSTLIDKGQAGYAEVAAKMAAQADLNQRVNTQLGTLTNLWDAASGTFINTLAAWAGAIAPQLKAITTWFGEVGQAVQTFIGEHPQLAQWTAGIVAFGSAALVLGGALSLAAGAVMTLLAPLVGPLGLALAAFAAAAALIIANWEPIKGFFQGLWAGLTAGLAPLAPAFTAAFNAIMPVIQPVLDALQWLWDKLAGLVTPAAEAGAAAQAMGQQWGTAIANMIVKLSELVAAVLALPGQMLAAGIAIVQGLWNGLQAKWGELAAWWSEKTAFFSNMFSATNEIKSPSRVFAGLGGELMRGLTVGIERLAGSPLAAVRALAASVAAVPLALAPMAAPANDLMGHAASLLPPASEAWSIRPLGARQTDLAPMTAPASDLMGHAASLLPPTSEAWSSRPLGARQTDLAALADRATAAGQRVAAPLAGAPSAAPARTPAPAPSGGRGGAINMPITINVQAPPNTDANGLATLIEERLRRAAGDAARHLSGLYDDPDEV